MKLLLALVLIHACVSVSFLNKKNSHNQKHFLHKSKSKAKVALRLKSYVSIKTLNLKKISIHRLNKKDGLELNPENAEDLYQTCTEGDKSLKAQKIQDFEDIGKMMVSTLEKNISPQIMEQFWVYYVSTEDKGGKCKLDANFGMQFMMIPKGNPMTIDFKDPNNRVGLVKVCANVGGNKGKKSEKDNEGAGKPYLLMNCAFDTCATTNLQDKMKIENTNSKDDPIKGNCAREIDEEESVTIQNSQNKLSLKIVGSEQINSIGKLIG